VLAASTGCGASEDRATSSWDYVALGDSAPAGAGDLAGKSFVYAYACLVEQDTGASVAVHSLAHASGETSSDLLGEVQGMQR
jgi:hypothetical protein